MTEEEKKAKRREANEAYYKKNKNKINAQHRATYQNMDPSEKKKLLKYIAESNRKRRAENPDARRRNCESSMKYYYEHRDEVLAKRKIRYQQMNAKVKKLGEKEEK